MDPLSRCPSCEGLVPGAASTCPHCHREVSTSARRSAPGLLLGAVGAGIAAITLMACYGMPPCTTPAPDGGTKSCYDVDDTSKDAGVDAGTSADAGH